MSEPQRVLPYEGPAVPEPPKPISSRALWIVAVLMVVAVAGAVAFVEVRHRRAAAEEEARRAAEMKALSEGADRTVRQLEQLGAESHARSQRLIRRLNLQTKRIEPGLTEEEAAELRELLAVEARERVESLGK